MASTTAPYYAAAATLMIGNRNNHDIHPDLGGAVNDHGIGNDQFAGLLEAATAAAGQEAQDCQKGVDPKKAVIKHLPMRATRLSSVTDKQGEQNGRPLPGNLKRRRTSAVNVQQHSLVPHTYREGSDEASERPSKRKRVREPSESDCLEIAAKDPQDGQGSTSDFRAGPRQQSLSDARTAGVHSAAALFRRVSSTSRKHTRPPMSKLFSSLELPPEVFLHLQAAAKGYMLDPVHPERTDCVGQRGKGDTEMVKLRLWHCVKEFLEGEGFGEKFFGRHVPGDCGTTRALVWPSQANEIISALTPLLRRMVTNERQRQYALVTRKGSNMGSGRKKMVDDPGLSPDRVMNLKSEGIGLPDLRLKLNGRLPDTGEPPQSSGKYKEDARLDNLGILSGLPSEDWNGLVAAVGDHVRMFHYGDRPRSSGCLRNCDEETTSEILQTGCLDHGSWRAGIGGTIAKKRSFAKLVICELFRTVKAAIGYEAPLNSREEIQCGPGEIHGGAVGGEPPETLVQTLLRLRPEAAGSVSSPREPVKLQISILREGKRFLPRFDTPDECPDLQTLYQIIMEHYSGCYLSNLRIQVLLSDGLQPVASDDEWMLALRSIQSTDWMDGDMKVIVEFEEA